MDLSGTHIVLIFLIALLVLGPAELIKYSVQLGKLVAKLRTQYENFKVMTQSELLKHVDEKDLSALKEVKNSLQGLGANLDQTLGQQIPLNSTAKKIAALDNSLTELVSEAEVEANILKIPLNVKGLTK